MWIIILLGMPLMCHTQQCDISSRNQNIVQTLSNGNLDFAIKLYKSIANENNAFISPFSISVALAMTAVGARGTTLAQMKSVLQLNGFQNQDKINQAFFSVLDSICSNSNYTLSTANRIYMQNNFPILSLFLNMLTNYYKSGGENVDFQDNPDGAAQQISEWVEQQTNNTIKSIFPAGSLNSFVVLVLVNAIYFKGSWQKQFELTKTLPWDFKLANGQTVSVPMMNIKDNFYYAKYDPLQSKVLQLKYAGDRLVMYVILPNQINGLAQLQQQLTSGHFNAIRQQLFPKEVIVKIPKFKLNFRKQLSGTLQGLGMIDAFSEALANLSGIAKPKNGKLFVSQVIHQAFVDVNEEGTTAAGATGVVVAPPSIDFDSPTFTADRPFLFIIYDTLTKLILFIGHVDNPKV